MPSSESESRGSDECLLTAWGLPSPLRLLQQDKCLLSLPNLSWDFFFILWHFSFVDRVDSRYLLLLEPSSPSYCANSFYICHQKRTKSEQIRATEGNFCSKFDGSSGAKCTPPSLVKQSRVPFAHECSSRSSAKPLPRDRPLAWEHLRSECEDPSPVVGSLLNGGSIWYLPIGNRGVYGYRGSRTKAEAKAARGECQPSSYTLEQDLRRSGCQALFL